MAKTNRKLQSIIGKVWAYAKSRGATPGQGISPWSEASKALEVEGFQKELSETYRKHAIRNLEYILAEAEKAGVPPRKRKKRTVKQVVTDGVDVTTDAFLETYAWRKLRMQAIKLHGARCLCCGASPATGAVINVDHIKPRKLFPELALTLSNLQTLCGPCNHGKGNWDQTDWRLNRD